MITIELPWPDKRLSPNSRAHWRTKSAAAYDARWEGISLTQEAKKSNWLPKGLFLPRRIEANYMFHPPDKRKRDIDNCLTMMKNYQDGVCAGLDIDDYRIKRTVIEWGEVVKEGKVVLRLEEMK